MSRKLFWTFAVLLLLLSGKTAVFADPGVKMVPFTARYDSGPADFTRSLDACVAKEWGTAFFEVSGTATHMGKMAGTLTHCFNLETGVFDNGLFIFTGANGDSLFGAYDGQMWGETYTVSCTFIGGTGRFANASGPCGGVGVFKDMVTFEFHTDLEGFISTVGSSK